MCSSDLRRLAGCKVWVCEWPRNGVCGGGGDGISCPCHPARNLGTLLGVYVKRTWGRPSSAKYILEVNTQYLKLLGDGGLRQLDGSKALEKTFWL